VTLYATTTRQVLGEIRELGKHAFPKGILPSLRLFRAERIPDRRALEQSGLFSTASCCKLIRFGVHGHFSRDYLEYTSTAGITPASLRPGVEVKDLNEALRTGIQVFKPK
jgi:hypothetical protein